MSIPVLVQAYDEVRRLAIAGSLVAPGDFRLKKLLPPLEQSGKKAPVFARVAESVGRLVDSGEQTSAAALLDLATLINSILYTQGETGMEGELSPLATSELGRFQTRTSARMLKPLREALTSAGSGRLEIIRDGHDRGAFRDLRLMTPALAALDDSYAEIADFVAASILPLYGAAIVPELAAGFDPKGRGGHVRRLTLMHRLAPDVARPHVLRSLDEGSAEVRVAAIGCLGDSPDDLPFLLEQAKSRAKDVRAAALMALGRSGADEAARVLCEALRNDSLSLALEPLRQSRHPLVTGALLDEAEAHYKTLLESKEKDVKKLSKQNERMELLLRCLSGREDLRTETLLLAMFGETKRIAAIKGTPDGKDVLERLVRVMAEGPPRVQSAPIDSHATLPAEHLGEAFVAALKSRTPAEVFATFSPYLARGGEKKKGRDPARDKSEAIRDELERVAKSSTGDAEATPTIADLDPRWLDLAVQIEEAGLVLLLARPGHAGAADFLTSQLRATLRLSGKAYEATGILDVMLRIGHPGATDGVIDLIRLVASGKSSYGFYGLAYWIGRLIPRMPAAEALPKLEALLPTLPEAMIDQLLGYVTDLKHAETTPAST